MDHRSSAAADRPPIEQHVHDAVDLASGAMVSTVTDARPTHEARLSTLQHLGFPGNIDVFGTPSHRLTPRAPYQASPEGYLYAFACDWDTGNEQLSWRVPATFDNYKATCNASFSGVAAGARLLSIDVEVWPYTGRTGKVVVFVEQTQVTIPVSVASARTIDVSFTHDGSPEFEAMIVLQQGIIDFVVHSVTLGSPGIVVTTQQPTA